MCSARGRVAPATIVDHKVPHEGNQDLFWDVSNLQGLCASCHSGRKRIQENKGFSQAASLDGLPIDPSHPWNRTRGEGKSS